MKKLLLFVVIINIVSCNTGETKKSTGDSAADTKKESVSYAYPINYSSQFEIGDPEKSKIILNLWKDFDNNTLDNAKGNFADSVTMDLPGMVLQGSRDSVISSTKAYRNSLGSVASTIDAVISTRSTDKKEDWVLVWGTEVHTSKKNVIDSVHLQEIWRLNKDGKIDYMSQYARQPAPPVKKAK